VLPLKAKVVRREAALGSVAQVFMRTAALLAGMEGSIDATSAEMLNAIVAVDRDDHKPGTCSGGAFCAWCGPFGQTLCHASLPTGAGGAPTLNDFGRQAKADELTRVF
jgi:hypothetical protein